LNLEVESSSTSLLGRRVSDDCGPPMRWALLAEALDEDLEDDEEEEDPDAIL
jgi:hypothetical protein